MSTLRGRLIAISVVQGITITIMALVVAYFTIPRHHGPPPSVGPSFGPLLTLALMLVVLLVGAYLTGGRLIPPITQLHRAARRLGEGDFSTRVELEREDELGDLATAFNEMGAKIETLVLAERELVANISHELRTPLSRIRVALELAEDGDADMAREALPGISNDLAEIEGLIDDIMASARFERALSASAAVFANETSTVAASSLVERAVTKFSSRHPNRTVVIGVMDDVEVDVHVVLMRRVLENLLENAHKYSSDPEAPVSIEVRSGDYVEIEVSDRGDGIPESEQAQLFEPFFRGSAEKSNQPGHGLGLALAKRIVEAHEGTIELQSAPGEGTSLTIRVLPHTANVQ